MVVRLSDVQQVIRDLYGEQLAQAPALSGEITHVLRSFSPRLQTLSDLENALENTLYGALYGLLGESMLVQRGRDWHRITPSEISSVADAMLGVLFSSMTDNENAYLLVRTYALESGSFNALAALYCRFQDRLPPEDRELISRILRDRLAGRPLPDWLRDPNA